MTPYDLCAVAAGAVSQRPGRPATAIVHDSADTRLVVFRLAPGEEVAPHTSPSTVILTVVEGQGAFLGPDRQQSVTPGMLVAYEPNELHGMRATTEPLVVLATIAPRPGTR